jgi:molybdate transport system substrate-binding protein
MKKITMVLLLSVYAVCLFAVSAAAADLNLSVAASLREAVTELSSNFSKTHPGVNFLNNFGASGALAKQIENGAPADLFFSANTEWMDYLKAKKLMEDKRIGVFAFNALVFVGMPGIKAKTLQDIAALEKVAIGSPASVPAGQYAMEALVKTGMDKKLANKLVMAKDVRECLMYAERGEVSGAFVYRTDALQMAKKVKILFDVPQDLYSRVTYPVGLTLAGSRKAEAAAFYDYLRTGEAKAVLAKHGFVTK